MYDLLVRNHDWPYTKEVEFYYQDDRLPSIGETLVFDGNSYIVIAVETEIRPKHPGEDSLVNVVRQRTVLVELVTE